MKIIFALVAIFCASRVQAYDSHSWRAWRDQDRDNVAKIKNVPGLSSSERDELARWLDRVMEVAAQAEQKVQEAAAAARRGVEPDAANRARVDALAAARLAYIYGSIVPRTLAEESSAPKAARAALDEAGRVMISRAELVSLLSKNALDTMKYGAKFDLSDPDSSPYKP